MKIGVICDCGTEKNIKNTKVYDYGAVELYRLDINRGKKTPTKRRLRRIAKALLQKGISICVAPGEFSELCRYGITAVSDGNDILEERAGQAAALFAEKNGIDADFFIDGGSFYNVYEAAVFLLGKRRHIYIRNPAFPELSEKIFSETGAVVSCETIYGTVCISMNRSEKFLTYEELSANLSDFKVSIEGFDFPWLSAKAAAALASILEKSGFLEKNRVKIEYFSNKIVNS